MTAGRRRGGATLLVAALALAGCGSGSSTPTFTGGGYPNVDQANSRYVGGPIDLASVGRLKVAWSMPLSARSEFGSYSSSPIVSGGVIYSQDLSSNVEAIDRATGKVLWYKGYESPDQGPNGLVVAGGLVFGATATAAFALDERTGRQLWSVDLVRGPNEGIDMAPGYHDGIVYVSTVPGNNSRFYAPGGAGTLWALDAHSGRRLWNFQTVPSFLWAPTGPALNAGGGLWYPPAFDAHGDMYFGVGNPAPFPGTAQAPWGSSRPGPDLYTDSLVKLDARTGKLRWYYQLTPHDLYDHDLQDPPILVERGGREIVLEAGKGGIAIALDGATGKLLWRRPVGRHNGHDQDSLYAMRGEYSRLHMPETVYPGLLGGVIAPMASNGSLLFVPVVDNPEIFASQTSHVASTAAEGEVVALDVGSGAVRWKRTFPSPALGALSAVNDLVFATTEDGEVYALSADSGHTVWRAHLPAGTNSGVVVQGDLLLAPAGLAAGSEQSPELVAFRLGDG